MVGISQNTDITAYRANKGRDIVSKACRANIWLGYGGLYYMAWIVRLIELTYGMDIEDNIFIFLIFKDFLFSSNYSITRQMMDNFG